MKNLNAALKVFFTLALALVMAGCSNVLLNKPENPDREIPPGKGLVRWSIGLQTLQTVRTTLPALPFTRYELSFTAAGKETVTETFTGTSAGELMLESGRWELSVDAYIGGDLAAQGSTPVVVLGGRTNSVTVTLKVPGVSGTGSGTLGYTVTLPADLLYAELSVASLDGGYSTEISLMTAASGSIASISDGYYILVFTLRDVAARRAVITDLVHVYDGLTTNGVYDLSDAPFADAPEISVPSGGAVVFINSAEDLAAIAGDITNPAKNNGANAYILAGDIDLSAYGPWTPLGTDTAAPFEGYLFGEGHTIQGLELPGGNTEAIGLFGYTESAHIENVNVEIAGTELTLTGTGIQALGIIAGQAATTVFKDIRIGFLPGGELTITKAAGGLLYTGGLAGNVSTGSQIEKCSFVGNITAAAGGNQAFAGGLAGMLSDGTITESYMVGTITHTNTAAGATGVKTAGLANGGTLQDCYHNGNIRASGVNLETSGLGGDSVSRCYATGSIVNNGTGSASGLSSGTTINNSAALNLAVTGVSAGRIAADSTGSLTNNYALSDMRVNGLFVSQNDKNGLGKTAAELQTQSTYKTGLGWDFDDVWEMGPSSYPYPILKRQKGEVDLPEAYGLVELPEDFCYTVTTMNEVESCLEWLPQNTAQTPHQVKLTGFTIGSYFGTIIYWLAGRYVNLDMSGCLDTIIEVPGSPASKAGVLSIVLPDSLVHIGDSAFRGYSSLVSVELSASVTTISYNAFRDCTSLVSIDLPPSLTTINNYAFYGCTSLASIDIPSGVTTIGPGAFYGCTSLASIVIPSGVTIIWDSTFSGCTSLASIVIPSGVTIIRPNAFYGCTSLASVDIPSSVTTIVNSAFYGCTSLASIVIPPGVTIISDSTFSGCTSLASVDIPSSVSTIGGYAFYNCTSLASIDIPANVTDIGSFAFGGCGSLTSVVCRATVPPAVVDSFAFSNTNIQTIKVPAGSVAAYQAAAGWSGFADKITAIP
jgi:hypothetical protein